MAILPGFQLADCNADRKSRSSHNHPKSLDWWLPVKRINRQTLMAQSFPNRFNPACNNAKSASCMHSAVLSAHAIFTSRMSCCQGIQNIRCWHSYERLVGSNLLIDDLINDFQIKHQNTTRQPKQLPERQTDTQTENKWMLSQRRPGVFKWAFIQKMCWFAAGISTANHRD